MAHITAVTRVEHAADPRLDDYRTLTDSSLRRMVEPAGGLFIAEGELVIRRAVAADYVPRSVLLAERWLAGLEDLLTRIEAPIYLAPEPILRELTGFEVHRGALAAMHRLPLPAPADILVGADRIAVLEGMTNPTNVGAVFRAAAGLGMDAVLLDPRCADPLYRRSLKVSMGSVLAVPYARFGSWPDGLRQIREEGFSVLALTPDPAAIAIDDLEPAVTDRCALLFGTEGPGLTSRARAAADLDVRIPMARGVDSLNVGSAAAVAFWAVTRRPRRSAK